MSRLLVVVAVLGVAACAGRDAEPAPADTAAVAATRPPDGKIKTDTVMVAGDTAKTD